VQVSPIDLIPLLFFDSAFARLRRQQFLFKQLFFLSQRKWLTISILIDLVLLGIRHILEILLILGGLPLTGCPFRVELILLLTVHYNWLVVLVPVIHIDLV